MTRRTRRTDHHRKARAMKRRPGEWMQVAVYNGSQSAHGAASKIRAGELGYDPETRTGAFGVEPAGTFETKFQQHPDGTAVLARYVPAELDGALREQRLQFFVLDEDSQYPVPDGMPLPWPARSKGGVS